jgi:hypothetical protein
MTPRRPLPFEQVRAINDTIEAGNAEIARVMSNAGFTLEEQLTAAREVAAVVGETATAVQAIVAGAYA